MIILGMTGPISHGKSTLAKALAESEPATIRFESSLVIAEVADAMHNCLTIIPAPGDIEAINDWLANLPKILLERFHVRCEYAQIKIDPVAVKEHPVEYDKLFLHLQSLRHNPNLAQQPITNENKETYRPFLQWLGGYLVLKVNSGLWYNEIVRRINQAEQQGYKLCIVGGLRFPTDAAILRAAGGKVFKVYRPGHLQNDILDPTERERENITIDCTVVSNGTVEDVKVCAAHILEDIRHDRLRPVYYTTRYSETIAAQ